MLKWENVSFAYAQSGKKNVLDGACVSARPACVTVLTGPSGCGKSTLLHLAAGLYPKNAGRLVSGRVTLDGRDPAALPPERRARLVGMMFQNPDLQFCMDTVKNELVFCLENIAMRPEEMDGAIGEALDFCGISHLKDRRLQTLSGGEKQKAMLACIYALRPAWLLLDEPFANIDPAAADEIAASLRKLATERGVGIVAVDHHLDVWEGIADEVAVLEKGGRTARVAPPGALLPDELEKLGVAVPALRYQPEKPCKTPSVLHPVLRVRGLRVGVGGNEILRGADADFYRGRIHVVVGGSGSGKSTFFHALCGLRRYTGSIEINGRELKKTGRAKIGRQLGCVFQNPQDQFVAGSVMGEITAGMGRLAPERAEAEAGRILRETGLWRYRFVSPYMLSQGQQRRLGVAALLAHGCGLLVCDEPTYAQDRRSILAVMSSLQKQVTQNSLALVFSTHDHKLARDYADILYRLEGGRLHEIHPSDL